MSNFGMSIWSAVWSMLLFGVNLALRHMYPRSKVMSWYSLMSHLLCIFTLPVFIVEYCYFFSQHYSIEIKHYDFVLATALAIGLIGIFSALRKTYLAVRILVSVFYSIAATLLLFVWSFAEAIAHATRMP